MKEYIRDDGKVRECTSNIAKMNIFEYMFYRKAIILRTLRDSLQNLFEGLHLVVYGVINLLIILTLPISYPLAAYMNIRRAKKEMELHEKYKSKPL